MTDAIDTSALAPAWTRIAQAMLSCDAIVNGSTKTLSSWGSAADPIERAEAYDYWAQLVSWALRREFHYAHTDHPMFHRNLLDGKIGFDNPDNVSNVALIDPNGIYRITGDIGDTHFIEISVSCGFPGVVIPPRTVGKLDTTELDIGPDGSIELIVGGEQNGRRNWLPLAPDATSILVRQVFGVWGENYVTGDFRITKLEGEGDRSPPLALTVGDRLNRAARFLETQSTYWLGYSESLVERIAWNTFEAPGLQGKELEHVNAARAFFCWGLFDIAPDEALIVEIKAPPEGAYLGFSLLNYWLQSLDFVGRHSSLNGHQARADDDGIIRFVLAPTDPGVPNWMDMGDHPKGGMLFRQALMPTANQPTARLVKLADVRDALPAGTPQVTPEERSRKIASRRAHVQSRFRW